jgi:hypothetical protein
MMASFQRARLLPAREHALAMVLADHAREIEVNEAWCELSLPTLIDEADMSKPTVLKGLAALEALGIIRKTVGGGASANQYAINLLWLEDAARRLYDIKRTAKREHGRHWLGPYREIKEAERDQLLRAGVPLSLIPDAWRRNGITPRPDELATYFGKGRPTNKPGTRSVSAKDRAKGTEKKEATSAEGGKAALPVGGKAALPPEASCFRGHYGQNSEIYGQNSTDYGQPQALPQTIETKKPSKVSSSSSGGGRADSSRQGTEHSASGEAEGQSEDGQALSGSIAIEIAVLYWCATGIWSPPKGCTSDLGPPPDAQDAADRFGLSASKLRFRYQFEILPALEDRRGTAAGRVGAMQAKLRERLAGGDQGARERVRVVERLLGALKERAVRETREVRHG